MENLPFTFHCRDATQRDYLREHLRDVLTYIYVRARGGSSRVSDESGLAYASERANKQSFGKIRARGMQCPCDELAAY